ncbi:MAG: TolC family protein [Myxococcota bacterium]
MISVLGWWVAVQLAGTPITLEQVREESRRQLDAVRAELDVQRAGSDRKTARSSIFPQVDFSVGASDFIAGPQRTFSTVPEVQPDGSINFVQKAVDTPGFSRGNFSLNLTVQQLIYDGGRWWNQIAQAGAQEEAAKGQLEEQRLSSELEATRRFFNLLNAQVQLKTLEETVKRSREQVERAKGLYEAGRSPRSSWLDAQVNLGNDEISVLRQRQNIVSLRTQLLSWLGRSDGDVEAVVPEQLDFTTAPPAFDAALGAAKKQRPLIRALEQRLRAQEIAIDVARADYWPRLSASAGYGRSSPSADPFFTDPTKQNSVNFGVNLSWDLFSGLAHQANVERARVELTRSQREQQQTLIELEAELKRTLATLQSELAVLTIAERNLELAKQQEQLETERFSAGASTSLDVRNAQIKLTQAELAVVQGKANVAVARAALRRVVGGTVEANP